MRPFRIDWRATEARINALPQFRTELDGLGIHLVPPLADRERADADSGYLGR